MPRKSQNTIERERNQALEALRSRPVREKARAFLDEVTLLCEKYDMLNKDNPDSPEVCSLSLSGDKVTVFVKWPFKTQADENGIVDDD